MNDPVALSDRALKILLILWRAATPISRLQIMATYGRPISNQALQIALTELENARLASRIGYRDGWQATPNSKQLILGEVSLSETSTLASSSSFKLEESKNNRELLLARHGEVSLSETSPQNVDNFVDNSPQFVDNLETCKSYGIREPKASKIAAMPHVNPQYIKAHVFALAEEDLPMAIWRIENKVNAPKKKHPSRSSYLDYLED